jgi:hypothetical protein
LMTAPDFAGFAVMAHKLMGHSRALSAGLSIFLRPWSWFYSVVTQHTLATLKF